jgi:hypothetical protein
MQAIRAGNGGPIEVLPLVVTAQSFPARPSALPNIRDFVRQRLGQSSFTEDDVRALGDQLLETLLDVAGPTGMIQVAVRIFPDHAEIDVLPATLVERVTDAMPVLAVPSAAHGNGNGHGNGHGNGRAEPALDRLPPAAFAEWLSGALRRESMTMEALARRLQVSVKTVSRWVGGSTEPRLRDLSRIREIFGDLPFP